MIILYNLILTIFFITGLPIWIIIACKKKYRSSILRKLVLYSKKISKKYIMIHGVSVGEVNAALPLIEKIKTKYPEYSILVTSSTLTGFQTACTKLKSCTIEYFPLDFFWSVKRFLKLHHIEKIFIMETEIWPNFVYQAAINKIPVYIANGRLSDRSFPRYKMLKFCLQSYFNNISKIFCASKTDAVRFKYLGVEDEKLQVSSSMKFDAAVLESKNFNQQDYVFHRLLEKHPLIFVAGSTQEAENIVIINAYLTLKEEFSSLKLILVPRKPETLSSTIHFLKDNQIAFTKRSLLTLETEIEDVLLVDIIGELFYLYSYATIVFIGKSLFENGGGQNPIEPAVLGKPVIIGKLYANFKDIVEEMRRHQAIAIVQNQQELVKISADLLKDVIKREEMGLKAKEFIYQKAVSCAMILKEI